MTKKPETPKATAKIFTLPLRVYWPDTDAGGIVYHPNYLTFALKARCEYMQQRLGGESAFYKKHGILLVVRHAEVDYRASAKLDDMLAITVEPEKFGNSSFSLIQNITRDTDLLATVKITLVAVNKDNKATRIPPQLRQIFEG